MTTETRKSQATTSQDATVQSKEAQTGCCGGAAPQGANACCALDAEIKSTGGAGCGCAPRKTNGARQKGGCC